MTHSTESYELLCQHARETAILDSVSSLLSWDERTQMPESAGEYRAEQMALLAGELHKRQTDKRIGEWLAELVDSPLTQDPSSDTGATILRMHRDFAKRSKLPQKLVEEISRTASLGEQIWTQTRKTSDFLTFQPYLEKMFALKREEADAYGYVDSPYDALLDDFEPGITTKEVKGILSGLVEELVPLVQQITQSKCQPNVEILKQHCSVKAQEAFGHRVSQAIGFDYTAGRLDVTAHPFCCTTGPRDVRLTTRYETHWLPGSLFGTLHEAGHGLYEQGLRAEQFGLPLGKAVSLGIHESQSRMWENMVGRSKAFWKHFYPAAQETFPEAFGPVELDDFYAAINYVQPSLIRVEADEATYNLHIVIRFELEQAMLCGELAVADLPEAWNQKYEDYLGIRPHSNKDGCMQDVHWAAGLIGYFPTYSLGNLFAGHFFAQAEEELGDLDTMFAAGQFAPLLEWLRTNIHHHGQRYSARELVQRITQENLSHKPLVDYLKNKLCPLYEVES